MSQLDVVALVLASLWMGLLTLVVLLAIRQIGLLTVRIDQLVALRDVMSPHEDGLELGADVPSDALTLLPAVQNDSDPAVLLHISAHCSPCRALAVGLQEQRLSNTHSLVALVTGRHELAQGLASALPAKFYQIFDPDATTVVRKLEIHSTPFALVVENSKVVRKAHLHTVNEFYRLVETGTDGLPPVLSAAAAELDLEVSSNA